MNRVLMRLVYWALFPALWIATAMTKRMLRKGDSEKIARDAYEEGIISAEQYEAFKRGEVDLFDAMKKGYSGRKIVIDSAGDIRGEGR